MIDIQQNSPIELLQNLGIWKSGEHIIHTEVPGESNMNLVLRIKTNLGSYILNSPNPLFGNTRKSLLPSAELRWNTDS